MHANTFFKGFKAGAYLPLRELRNCVPEFPRFSCNFYTPSDVFLWTFFLYLKRESLSRQQSFVRLRCHSSGDSRFNCIQLQMCVNLQKNPNMVTRNSKFVLNLTRNGHAWHWLAFDLIKNIDIFLSKIFYLSTFSFSLIFSFPFLVWISCIAIIRQSLTSICVKVFLTGRISIYYCTQTSLLTMPVSTRAS